MTPNRVRVCGLSVEILSLDTEELLQIFHKLLRVNVLDVRSYPHLQCAVIKLSSVKSVDHVIVVSLLSAPQTICTKDGDTHSAALRFQSKDLAAADVFAQRVALGLYTTEQADTRLPQDFNTEVSSAAVQILVPVHLQSLRVALFLPPTLCLLFSHLTERSEAHKGSSIT